MQNDMIFIYDFSVDPVATPKIAGVLELYPKGIMRNSDHRILPRCGPKQYSSRIISDKHPEEPCIVYIYDRLMVLVQLVGGRHIIIYRTLLCRKS